MIEEFYQLKPEVLVLDRKALDLCREQFAHVEEIRSFLQEEVAQLEPKANVHDLRIVPGPSHTNVIFDCAVPAEYLADKQRRGAKLVAALRTATQQKWPDHFCVIKLEPDYAPCTHTQN